MSNERKEVIERRKYTKVEEKIGKEFDNGREKESKLDEVYRKAGGKFNTVKNKEDKGSHTYMGKKLGHGKDTF
jgi:hypothetical protein